MRPQRGQKAFALQTLAPTPVDEKAGNNVARTGWFSLHAGIAAKAHQREKLERLFGVAQLRAFDPGRRADALDSCNASQRGWPLGRDPPDCCPGAFELVGLGNQT